MCEQQQGEPAFAFFDHLFEFGESFEGNRCCEFDFVAAQHRKDVLIEKCGIHARFKDRVFDFGFGLFKTVQHEFGRPIRVVDIAGAMENVEKLAGLCHGAEQRIVTSSAFFALLNPTAVPSAWPLVDRTEPSKSKVRREKPSR